MQHRRQNPCGRSSILASHTRSRLRRQAPCKGLKDSEMTYQRVTPTKLSEIDELHPYFPVEIARMMKVTVRTIQNWMDAGKIEYVVIGSCRYIMGKEAKRLLGGRRQRDPYVEYTGRLYPWTPYMMYLVIETKMDKKEIRRRAAIWHLQDPSDEDLDAMWNSLIMTAPTFIRAKMENPAAKMPTLGNEKFKEWVRSLGILELYDHIELPCLDILEDYSDKRIDIEVLLCGRVPYKEICEILDAKHNFRITEDDLNFYAKFFFNTYTFNQMHVGMYLSNIRNSDEARKKRSAWGVPVRAKLAVEFPIEADRKTILNQIIQECFVVFTENIHRGGALTQMALEAVRGINSSHEHLLKEEKSEAAAIAAAKAEASQSADNSGATFETKSEEPVDISELDQPADVAEDEEESDFGGQAEVG